jgi:hypothetical protein
MQFKNYLSFISLSLLLGFAYASPTVAESVEKFDGFSGFVFGMDYEQADAVMATDKTIPCHYPEMYKCIAHDDIFLGKKARVIVQLGKDSKTVDQILLEFDRVHEDNKNSECDEIANYVLRELLNKYDEPANVNEREATWFGEKGGMLVFTSLCVDRHKGMVTLVYKKSNSF